MKKDIMGNEEMKYACPVLPSLPSLPLASCLFALVPPTPGKPRQM